MATTTKRKAAVILQATLQNFLRNEKGTLSQSPILLISSQPESSKVADKTIDLSLQKFQFHVQNELGLPLFPSKTKAAFCTQDDIKKALAIKNRMGATIVIGMGSGVAMDLAKATAKDDEDLLYLIPSTSAALLASQSNMSLTLDTIEETIVVTDDTNNVENVTVVVNVDDIVVHPHTFPACKSILIDAALRGDSSVDVGSLFACGNSHDSDAMLSLIQQASQHLSTGLIGDQHRSIPLALSSSLIPLVFSSTHVFTFWASLVPALAAQLDGDSGIASDFSSTSTFPSLASLALEPQSIETLLQHVRDNQTVCKAYDVNQDFLAELLAISLNR